MFKLIQLTIFFQSFGYLFQFIAFLLFAKMLGAENQGVLTVFVTAGQIIALLLSFGLPGGITYFGNKLNIPFLYQIVDERNIDIRKDKIRILSMEKFLLSLT